MHCVNLLPDLRHPFTSSGLHSKGDTATELSLDLTHLFLLENFPSKSIAFILKNYFSSFLFSLQHYSHSEGVFFQNTFNFLYSFRRRTLWRCIKLEYTYNENHSILLKKLFFFYFIINNIITSIIISNNNNNIQIIIISRIIDNTISIITNNIPSIAILNNSNSFFIVLYSNL